MSIQSEYVRYGNAKEHAGFCAWLERAAAPVPAIVVIQEAWGVDEHIEDVAKRFAKAGYVALAPDLFADNGERPVHFSRPRMEAFKEFVNWLPPSLWGDAKAREEALAKLPEPRRSEVAQSLGALTSAFGQIDTYVSNLMAAADYLRSEHRLSRGARVGSVGFCMGGTLSARLACADAKLGAAVIFYGNAPPPDRIGNIACPVLGLYGALDTRVNAGLDNFTSEMQKHGKRFERHVYEGAHHAFFNDTRPSYNAKAARDAFPRTLEFFRRELDP
jgi:carboxymethylenebutenolidase